MAAPSATAASSWGSGSYSGMGSSGSESSYSGSNSGDSWASDAASMATAASSWQTADVMSSDVMMTATAMATEVWSTADVMSSDIMMSSDVMSSYVNTWAATATAAATSTIAYGSGSSNWGGSGYENCVQQCMAEFGAPPSTMTAAASSSSSYSGSYSGSNSGSATTHTVVVAPTQGVLRFVPFTVNANPGDTIFYMWGANNHTVTKGSQLEICNETTDAFATGEHDKGFTFTETVNDTSPVFFYCSTPGHCEKGMFGIINPPSVSNNANTSVASMMPAMMSNSSTLSAMYAASASNISSNPMAASWGANMSMGSMPEWSQSLFAENVLYTRAFLAANPSVMQADGSIDMSAANGSWTLPQDISAALSSNTTSTASSSSTAPSSTTSMKSSAGTTTVSTALFGVAAIAATFLAL